MTTQSVKSGAQELSSLPTDNSVSNKDLLAAETQPADHEQIIFTENAANKVKELLTEEENPDLKLRVFISGGGCSGFQYGFTFDEHQNEDDFIVEKNGVELLIDVVSMQYLTGAEIDYKEDETGEQFVIRNPQAQSTCGCGSSFSV